MTIEPLTYEDTSPHWDAEELLLVLRQEDRIELEAGSGQPAGDVIMESIFDSHSVGTLRAEGKILAIVGLGDAGKVDDIPAGCPWLVGSTHIPDYALPFMRWSKDRVSQFLEQYAFLCNFVHAENHRSLRWLKALGFELMEPVEFGPNGVLFHPFYQRRNTDV